MKYFNCIICCAIMLVLISCEKDEDLQMPDITSSGLNKFGCYVNNELFVHTYKAGVWGYASLEAFYDTIQSPLNIIAFAENDRQIIIQSKSVTVEGEYAFWHGEYRDKNGKYLLIEDAQNKLLLTRYDRENLVVSGTFSFKARCEETGEVVTISEGRFDIKLEHY
jgi:hypothetical protein